jgi:hypothetical protein
VDFGTATAVFALTEVGRTGYLAALAGVPHD